MCGGDIPEATMQLMIRKPKLPKDHGLLGFNYGVTKLWGYAEVDAFVQALKKHSKNWPVVAKEVSCLNIFSEFWLFAEARSKMAQSVPTHIFFKYCVLF